MQVLVIRSPDELVDAAPQWNDLWDRSDSTFPLARAEPIANHVRFFHPSGRFLAIVVLQDDRWVAALPLVECRKLGLRMGSSLNNPWNFCGDLLIDRKSDTTAVIDALLRTARAEGLNAIWAEFVPLDREPWKSLIAAADALGQAASAERQYEYGETDIVGDWEAFQQTHLSRGRRKSLQKGARRLSELGDVGYWSLRHDADGVPLERAADEAFRLEHAGWKGDDRTSMLSQPGLSAFFLRQIQLLHAAGMVDLQFLKLDGSPIAFEIGYMAKGVYYSHKIGFDPRYRAVGPGQLLTRLQFERLYRLNECRRFDAMGILNDATATWTTSVHSRGRVIVSCGTWPGTLGIRVYRMAKWLYRRLRLRRAAAGSVATLPSDSKSDTASEIPVSATG